MNISFKKIFAAVISLVLTSVLLCSCVSDTDSEKSAETTEPQTEVPSTPADRINKVETGYCYESLSLSVLKEAYMKIDERVSTADTMGITVDKEIDEKNISEVIEAYRNDHPEVFWLESSYEYLVKPSGNTVFALKYSLKREELKDAEDKFDAELQKAVENAPKEATAYELELYAHDYLVNNCSYDEESAKSVKIVADEQNAYGALVDKKAVCEGYSRAFQLLCSKFGIECVSISGKGNGEPHQWNCVKLDGEWYAVDVTWDDADDDRPKTYEYFNVDSYTFNKDHAPALLYSDIPSGRFSEYKTFPNHFVPECSSTKYYYYTHSCVTISDVNNKEKTVDAIAEAAAENEKTISFYIDKNLDYRRTCNELINGGYLSRWVSDANRKNDYSPELNERCGVYCYDDLNIIIIELEYL